MILVSPPELALELAGPKESISVTRAPRRTRCSAVQPPKAPAPTTTTRGFFDGRRVRDAPADAGAPAPSQASGSMALSPASETPVMIRVLRGTFTRAVLRSRCLEALHLFPGNLPGRQPILAHGAGDEERGGGGEPADEDGLVGTAPWPRAREPALEVAEAEQGGGGRDDRQ